MNNTKKSCSILSILNTILILIVIILVAYNARYIKLLSKQLNITRELFYQNYIITDDKTQDAKICSPLIKNRKDFFALLPDINQINSLEIAPWHNPILIGKKVKYFDVLDKNGLIKKAIEDKQDINQIPKIDYVHPKGDMSLINEKFALIFSSHNIEHQVDLIKHLTQVANLLESNGKFFMAIPDKRYCFDHYIPTTPLSDVLATHWQKAETHSLQTILAMCETTHNNSKNHWQGAHGESVFEKDKQCYLNTLINFQNAKGAYLDAHKWRFTPESFYTIIEELYNMKLQPLRIEKISCTTENSHEFYVILYKP